MILQRQNEAFSYIQSEKVMRMSSSSFPKKCSWSVDVKGSLKNLKEKKNLTKFMKFV